ncbi:MAG: reverse transcriptase domain-containing protein [Parvibaculum sp.]
MKTHQIDEIYLPVGKTDQETLEGLKKDFQVVKGREKKRFKEYRKALETGDLKEIRKAVDRYLKSGPARTVAAVRGNLSHRIDQRLTLRQSYKLAEEFKPHKPLEEKVRAYGKKKSSGGERPICVFGHEHRLGQSMIKKLLKERLKPCAWQYTHRGPAAAIKYIKSLNPTAELCARKLDIKDFYGSFEEANLVSFLNEMPDDVVRHIILSNDNVLTTMDGSPLLGKLSQLASRGVAQGSTLSPLIGELAVSQLGWEGISEVQMLNYADDFLLIAPDIETLDEATKALTSAVAALPGGHFSLLKKDMPDIASSTSTFGAGVVFLGYYLQVLEGVLNVWPCNAATERFREIKGEMTRRIKKEIKQLKSKSIDKDGDEEVAYFMLKAAGRVSQLHHYVKAWQGAFMETDPITLDKIVGDEFEKIAEFSAEIGMAMSDVIKIEVDIPDVFEISGMDWYHIAKLIADA